MKILVFGAGVLGCNLARNFFRAGKDVTLLARGAWGESIPKNGLRIKDKFSPRMSVSRIPVTAELKAEDKYDVIFIVLRYDDTYGVRTLIYYRKITETRELAYRNGWRGEVYRTITFDEAPSGDLLAWLQENATPQ